LSFQAKNKIVMLKVLRDIRSRGKFRPINDEHGKHRETSGLLGEVGVIGMKSLCSFNAFQNILK